MVVYVLFIRIVIVITTRAAKIVGTEVATAKDIAIGRLGSDVARVIFWTDL